MVGRGVTGGDVTNAELARSIKRVEVKIDRISEDHEDRLRRLERAVWATIGFGLAGAGTGISALVQGFG